MENILNNFPEPNRDLPSSYPLPNWFDKEKKIDVSLMAPALSYWILLSLAAKIQIQIQI